MMAETVHIASMNCQGIGNPQKRRDVFHYLRKKSFSIYLLQDTHFDPHKEDCIRAEWGYKAFFSSFSSASRGVAILFNNNFEFNVKKVYKEVEGNYIFVHVNMMKKDFLIISLYGPNRDDPEFFEVLEERINEVGCQNVIMGGDWNLVLDFSLDYYNYKHCNNVKAHEQVENMKDNLDLLDIWREINPEVRRFTWRRNRPQMQQSRLDFFLLSDVLSSYVTDADIRPGYRTDHSLITLRLSFGKEAKRKLLWKLNSSLLTEKQYVDEVNVVIQSVTEEYAALPYARENIKNVPKSEIQLTISDQLFLDVMLMKIRSTTISYASMKKRTEEERQNTLERKISDLENQMTLTEEENNQLIELKQELISIRERKMKGVLLRSRARWVANGEKITNYFCSLEKRNYISKNMHKLKTRDGEEIFDKDKIMKEVKGFYEHLYTRKELEYVQISEMVGELPSLAAEEIASLEGHITLEEASYALKNMKNNKSPGSDGFTVEFFKVFWKQLGEFVVRSLNDGFNKGELSSTQKEGIIICIPKSDKEKDLIKNWRPISLINVAYKIGSTCIANRLKVVLPSLINEDQTGFVANRFIGDNIRLIYDLISYLNCENLPGLLLCLDFEKAFDSLDWRFMDNVLCAFKFGQDFRRWIETFRKNIKSSVSLNGQMSTWFNIGRGCRQGDPISPYLFILCAEILAIMIRENENIQGLNLNGTSHKISQYADDTEVLLNGDNKSFEETMRTIETFGNKSGLFLNTGKSSAIWLGSKRNSEEKFMPHLCMNWNPPRFKILGIWFSADLSDCSEFNIREKGLEVKALYKIWLKRQITPLGRIAVLKSLILSKLIHLWIYLPNPPDDAVNALQKTMFEFVWSKKRDRISRKTTVQPAHRGGLGIPDLKTYISSLKLIWLRKLESCKHKWKNIILSTNPNLPNLRHLGCNLPRQWGRLNDFWKDVFSAYKSFGEKIKCKTQEEVNAEPIFYNGNINIDKKSIFYKTWFDKGVRNIHHLIKDNGDFLPYDEFKRKYDIVTDYVTYIGCTQAIKKYIRQLCIDMDCDRSVESPKAFRTLQFAQKGAKVYYDILILTNEGTEPKCCRTWNDKLDTEVSWKTTFKKVKKIREVKMKWFQIRIVHRIIATNVVLSRIGVQNDERCSFCREERENIQHIFWNCKHVQQFWNACRIWINENCDNANIAAFTEPLILFGHDTHFYSDDVFDLIILWAKYFIYKCKWDDTIPNVQSFRKYLQIKYETEKCIAFSNMEYHKFRLDWVSYGNLVNL